MLHYSNNNRRCDFLWHCSYVGRIRDSPSRFHDRDSGSGYRELGRHWDAARQLRSLDRRPSLAGQLDGLDGLAQTMHAGSGGADGASFYDSTTA